MPNPSRYKDKKHFMQDCMHINKGEGRTTDQSLGRCLNIWKNRNKSPKKMASIAELLRKIATLNGRDVERLLTTPQEDYEEVIVHDTPCRGFLMADGSWLDIGGQDHRFINGMIEFDTKTEESFNHSQTKKMFHIMKLAKIIRFLPESKKFHTLTKPTRDQIHEIMKYCENHHKMEVEYGNSIPKDYNPDEIYLLQEDLNNYNGE
jgi:hypothetical protein